ncbi:MAG: DUF1566 domain-containing protein [Desulfuromonadaceae bacterium]|nr:DUF1566 domain-containing protein [Desulfuromonadaceae bacterium]MDD2856013.1 DUF1566 domain-containing protein [Desulfuromonadaceae bacterium]
MKNLTSCKSDKSSKSWFRIAFLLCMLLLFNASLALTATIQLPRTGQTTSYVSADDGALKTGAVPPTVRFTDNGDQTVTDTLTGLIWSKNANPASTTKTWQGALDYIKTLNSSSYMGYNDWRLPNVTELESLIDAEKYTPALPAGHPFSGVQSDYYWSSTSYADSSTLAWYVSMYGGYVSYGYKTGNVYVWPVRGGQSGSFGYLTILKAGSGSGIVSPDSGTITWSGNSGTASYTPDTVVTLTATADSGSSFVSWSGCDSSTPSTCSVTMSAAKSVTATFTDTQVPVISTFGLPATSTTAAATVTLTASDNVAITGYCLTEADDSTGCVWNSTKPTSYSFGGLTQGVAAGKSLYAFVKDGAGLISPVATATTSITLPDTTAPTISAFTLPASVGGLTATGIGITSSDNIGVTGYCLTETDNSTDCSWQTTKPASYTFSNTYGSRTLYAFVKDAAGNRSPSKSASTTLLQTGFALTTPAAIELVQGEGENRSLTITAVGGYSSVTSIAASFVGTTPVGVTTELSTASITPAASGSDITITVTTTAAASGSYTLRITASGGGDTKTVDIPLTISTPLTISSTQLTEGIKGTAYSAPITTSGGVGTINCSLANGSSLPAGLTLSGCSITGTPTARTITAPFSIRVSDGAATPHTATKELEIRVYDPAYRTLRLESASWSFAKAGALAGIIARIIDDYGTETAASSATAITLTSSSATGRFSADGMSWSLANTVYPTITAGTASYEFMYSDSNAGTFTLTASGKSGSTSAAYGSDSHAVTVTDTTVSDTTAPTVTNFTIPATSNTLTVAITALSAADSNGVSDYCITETDDSSRCSWSASIPVNHTFTTSGTKTLYAFARDGAGNISPPSSQSVTITFDPTRTVTLNINALAQSIAYAQSFSISGSLIEDATVTPLAYKEVCFIFTTPSATKTAENCAQTMSNGTFNYPVDSAIVDLSGSWSVALGFKGDSTYKAASVSRTFTVNKLDTTVTASSAPTFVSPSGSVIISGKLNAASSSTVNLIGVPVTVTITDSNNKEYTLNPTTSDSAGRFSIGFNQFGGITGIWSVRASFGGSSNLNASPASTPQNFTVAASTGYAILIQGDLNGSSRDSYTASMQRIHKQLTDRFITADNIWYLSPDGTSRANVDEVMSRTAIQNAITTWAYNRISSYGDAPLYIIMLDHGGRDGKFYIGDDSSYLTPGEMNGWITTLESNLKTNFNITSKIVIINGSCYSGSFIPGLKKTGRTIITSAAADKTAAQGPRPSRYAADQTILGDSFIHAFVDHLAGNSNLHLVEAFKKASETIERMSKQSPLFEDGSDDGTPYQYLADNDGIPSWNLPFGISRAASMVEWKQTMPAATAMLGTAPEIYAATTGDITGEAVTVWAEVKKPSFVMPEGDTGQINLNLPQLTARYNQSNSRWEFPADLNPGITDIIFNETGTYSVILYAEDLDGEQLPPTVATVYINDTANTAPAVPQPLEPAADAEQKEPLIAFSWSESADPDNDPISYTLIILADNNGAAGNELKRFEGIPQSATLLDAVNELKADGSKLFTSGTFWWQVTAVDSRGGSAQSETVKFSYLPQSGMLAFILGTVIDQSGKGVPSAKVKTSTATYTSLSNGYVLIPVSAGIYSLTAEKAGYTSATRSVTTSSGSVSKVLFNLTEVVSTMPGDCDGSKDVSIAEVQRGINMFLGLASAEICVDFDRSGTVSIAEVQKTINSFLGL